MQSGPHSFSSPLVDAESTVLPLSGPRVLLAEDQPAMRTLVAGSLRARGFDVIELSDGAALMRALGSSEREPEPELIITDVHMPGLDGLEVLSRLRLSDWATPVIVITAFGDRDTVLEAMRLGATRVLSKPFPMRTLLELATALVRAET